MSLLSFPRNRRLLGWLAWVITTVLLIAVLLSFDLRAVGHHLARAQPAWILAAILANFAVLPLLTEQWSRLLPTTRPLPWSVLWRCVTLAVAAMNTLPLGSGHAVGVGLVARQGRTGWPGALSLMALEQVCDAFGKLLLILAALAVVPLPGAWQRVPWILGTALLVGFLALLWMAHHPVVHPPSRGWRARWGRQLEVLKRPRVFLTAVGLSVAIKAAGLLAIFAVQRSLGVDLPFATTPLILGAVTVATLVSLAPSDLGIYEAAAFGAYRLLGVPPGEAVALAVLQHACFLIPSVGTGYAMTAWRSLLPARPCLAGTPD